MRCVYGDTDSAFLLAHGASSELGEKIGKGVAKFFATQLPVPHVLEYEKMIRPFLLVGPKMYAGTKYEGSIVPGSGRRIDRGIALARRDNFLAVVTAQNAVVEAALSGGGRAEALQAGRAFRERVRRSLAHLHDAMPPADALPASQFVQTGGLSKPLAGKGAYTDKDVLTPALAVAKRMRAAGARVGFGSRVPFYILHGEGPIGERAVSPSEFCATKGVLDEKYYLERVDKPMARALACFFAGDEVGNNSTMMGGGCADLRMGVSKGERNEAPGIWAAVRALQAPAARVAAECISVPEEATQKMVLRSGVMVLEVIGTLSGKAWARGSPDVLARLPWEPSCFLGLGGKQVKGRHVPDDVEGGWSERCKQLRVLYPKWV